MRFHIHRAFLREEAGAADAGGGAGTQQQASQQQQEAPPWIDLKTGAFGEKWLESATFIPEDLRPTASQYKDVPGLVKALRETKAALTGKIPEGMVQIPDKDSKPEVVAAYNRAVGIPEAPDKYNIKKPEGDTAKFYSDDLAKNFLTEAHKLGINEKQAQGIIDWQMQFFQQQSQAHQVSQKTQEDQDNAAHIAELKRLSNNNPDAKVMDAKRVALHVGLDPTLVDALPAKDIVALAAHAAKIGEDKLPAASNVNSGVTTVELGKDIMTNPGNKEYAIFHDPAHPMHQTVKKKALQMMGIGA